MANNDLKTMVKQALEKDAVFFEEAVTRMEDLRFYVSRFGGNCDDQLVQQVNEYIKELTNLKRRIVGAGDGGGSGSEKRNATNVPHARISKNQAETATEAKSE